MEILVKVLKKIGYHDVHKPGDLIQISIEHLNQLIKEGYVEIVVNNIGNNLPYDQNDFEDSNEYIFGSNSVSRVRSVLEFILNELRQSIYYIGRHYTMYGDQYVYEHGDLRLEISRDGDTFHLITHDLLVTGSKDDFDLRKGSIQDLDKAMAILSFKELG